MTYIIMETQTNGGVTVIVPPVAYTDRQQAEASFHSILSFAAVSSVEEHAVVMLTNDGRMIRNECYRHPAPIPEPESETEPEEEPEEP